MAYILGVLGSVAAVAYHILFDPSRRPAPSVWSTWDIELILMYGAAGFAIGWIMAVIYAKIGPDKDTR